jgi:hypothetical protein
VSDVTDNPPRNIALICLAITTICVIMIFVPSLIGMDGFEGGFAISFVSLVAAATGTIVSILYLRQANILNNILRGEGLLVHWVYPPEKWREYTVREYAEEKTEKKGLFILVSGFALFFGFLFWALDSEAGFVVFLVMLGLIGLVAVAWQGSAWYQYKQNMSGVAEAYIARNAVYMNRKLYVWRMWGSRFNGVALEEKRGFAQLAFKCTIINQTGSQTYTIRVPIPDGQEETAKSIVQQLT